MEEQVLFITYDKGTASGDMQCLVVGEYHDGNIKVLNTIIGDEAAELYNKLIRSPFPIPLLKQKTSFVAG